MKKLERNFRKEYATGRSCWSQLKPINTSQDPYIGNPSKASERVRNHNKELESKSPRDIRQIQQESKLYKPFKSSSLRTLET